MKYLKIGFIIVALVVIAICGFYIHTYDADSNIPPAVVEEKVAATPAIIPELLPSLPSGESEPEMTYTVINEQPGEPEPPEEEEWYEDDYWEEPGEPEPEYMEEDYWEPSGDAADFKRDGVWEIDGMTYTWYPSRNAHHYRTDEWWVDGDGIYRDSDGYVIIANDDIGFGEVIDTPFGPGKKYDDGCDHVDIYVNW